MLGYPLGHVPLKQVCKKKKGGKKGSFFTSLLLLAACIQVHSHVTQRCRDQFSASLAFSVFCIYIPLMNLARVVVRLFFLIQMLCLPISVCLVGTIMAGALSQPPGGFA